MNLVGAFAQDTVTNITIPNCIKVNGEELIVID